MKIKGLSSLNYSLIIVVILFVFNVFSCSGGYNFLANTAASIGKVGINGELCTDGPLITTSQVKVMLIIDGSASLFMSTDLENKRIDGANRLIQTYIRDPNVSFSIVRFTAVGTDLTNGFTRDLNVLQNALDECSNDFIDDLEGGDPDTGIKEGIEIAKGIIESDILTADDPDILGNTLYVSLLFSDGGPWYDADNSSAQFWQRAQDVYDKVDEYMSLNDQGAMRIMLNAAFLGDENDTYYGVPSEPLPTPYENAISFMRTVAQMGDGNFVNFEDANSIDFLNIISNSMSTPYNFYNFTASNSNMQIIEINGETAMNPDTDSDGIVDVDEMNTFLDFRKRDTDGDGCGDGFEKIYASNPKIKDCDCPTIIDSDGDKMLDCEERLIGTDPYQPDSDGDFIPDSYEFFSGLNPLNSADKYADLDGDGENNIWEFVLHTNPSLFNDEFSDSLKYRYNIALNGNTNLDEDIFCYDVEIENISVLYTEQETNKVEISTVQRVFDGDSYNNILSVGEIEVKIINKLGEPETPIYSLSGVEFVKY